MLIDIIMTLILMSPFWILLIWFISGNVTCNHKWEPVHDTKYDSIGFRHKYPTILVCTKCGKVKVIK